MRTSEYAPLLMVAAAVAAFCGLDACVKALAADHHVLLISFARYGIATLAALAIWAQAGAPRLTWSMWRRHALRGFLGMCSGTTFFVALSLLPLVEALTLGFISALLVAPAAQLMLGERMRPINLVAAAIGFVGVLIAAQGAPPGEAARNHLIGVAAVIVSCITYAAAMALTRAQALSDGPLVVQLLGAAIPAALVAAPAIALAGPPRLESAPLFLLMGALGALASYLMASAYARAEAQKLAPVDFTAAIWGPLYGYVFFQEIPRAQVLIAAPVIIGACLLVAWDARRVRPA